MKLKSAHVASDQHLGEERGLLVLCVGFSPESLEVLSKAIPKDYKLRHLSSWHTPARLRRELAQATVSFLLWDGLGRKVHSLLLSLKEKTTTQLGPIHVVLEGETVPSLPDSQRRELGLEDWLEIPTGIGKITRICETLKEAIAPIPLRIPAEHSGRDSNPQVASLSTDTQYPLAQNPLQSALSLQLTSAVSSILLGAYDKSLAHWQKVSPKNDPFETKENALSQERLVLVHPWESEGRLLIQHLYKAGVSEIILSQTVDDTMAALRRQATGLLIWFDGTSRVIDAILEHVAESKQFPFIPILVILPGRSQVPALSPQLRHYFFDAVMCFDDSAHFAEEAMLTLKRAQETHSTPRRLLERLRRPLKLETPPEQRNDISTENLELWAEKIQMRPEKKYWGLSELVAHYHHRNLRGQALACLTQISEMRPQAFNTWVLAALVAQKSPHKNSASLTLAQTVLDSPEMSRDRLYRVALMLERWGSKTALNFLIKAWEEIPYYREDPQLLWIRGRFLFNHNATREGLSYMSSALMSDPTRTDFSEGIARILFLFKYYNEATSLLRLVTHAPDCTWDSHILFARALLQTKNRIECASVLNHLLDKAPQNPDLKTIQSQFKRLYSQTPVERGGSSTTPSLDI